ncbi:MAG: putative intracellular protease/amidase [Dokdonia sp.]|jgi:putative intracellular protease/amidase
MFKKYRVLKWTLVTIGSLVLILLLFGVWFMSLIPSKDITLETISVKDLPYVSENVQPIRGKILTVVTSTDVMGSSEKSTGYELTELSRAYYVFKANGFEVDIASPLGGKAPVVVDDDDMGPFDYAFLNDAEAQFKVSNTITISNAIADEYQAIFFVGGKGAMFDFPDNKDIQAILSNYQNANKVIGAVCHGPAALVNVTLDNGRPLLENRKVSGFTNKEELLLISDAALIFPFLLQDKITAQGARFNEGAMYLEKVSYDKNLVTGQNPWSTWAVAETMIKQLGYTPKYREITDEENAVSVLEVYETQGFQKAKEMIKTMSIEEKKPINRMLIASHGIIGVMKGETGRFFDMVRLTSFAKKCASK